MVTFRRCLGAQEQSAMKSEEQKMGSFSMKTSLNSAWFENHEQKPKPVASLELFTSESCPFQSHSSPFAAQFHRRRLTHTYPG